MSDGTLATPASSVSPSGRPTLEEVARVAGVSRATVSRVINGSPRVSSDVLEVVEKAIAELNYVPNRAARSLVARATMAIALVVPEDAHRFFGDPYFADVVQGISDRLALEALARRRGRDLAAEGTSIVPMGGAQAVGSFLDIYGPHGFDVLLAGLCDEERTLCGDRDHAEAILVPDNEREWRTWRPGYRTRNQDRGIRFLPLYELVDERLPCLLIGLEGLRLAPRPVQGEHQLSAESLPQRMLLSKLAQLSDELAVPSARKIGLDSQLARRQT